MQVEEEREAMRMARKEEGEEEEKGRKVRKKRRERKLSVEEPSNSEEEREDGSVAFSVSSEDEEDIGEVRHLCVCQNGQPRKSMFANYRTRWSLLPLLTTSCCCCSNLSYTAAPYEGILL